MGLGLLGTPMTRFDGIKDLFKDRIGAPVLNVRSRLDPGKVRGTLLEFYYFNGHEIPPPL